MGLAFLPDFGAATHSLNNPVNLPRRNADAAGLLQMPLRFLVGRLIGSFQTDELGQSGRITHLQAQRGVDRIVALILALVVIVISLQLEAAKNSLNPNRFAALARLSGLGLVLGVDSVGGLLEQPADQRIGGFENRRAH